MNDLKKFKEDVGKEGFVAVVGGKTHWEVGGALNEDIRLVFAPTGIDAFDPSEMTVSVKAGTKLKDLTKN